MMYASTKDFFKGHLDGVSAEFQASEREEVAEAEVAEAVRALKRG
jgi:cofilin